MLPASARTGLFRSWWVLAALVVALGLAALGLLSYIVHDRATSAVRSEARHSLSSSASLTALFLEEQMSGIEGVIESYSRRLRLQAAIERPGGVDRAELDRQLLELRDARADVLNVAGFADPEGTLLAGTVATGIGINFSERDWYRGVIRSGETYVSEAFRGRSPGSPLAVAIASPVRDRSGRLIGIIVVGYTLDELQAFVGRFATRQGIAITVTDQRGVILVRPGGAPAGLVSRSNDPRVRRALAGRSGAADNQENAEGEAVLSAYAPVPKTGWTVVAEVPRARAYAQVARLQRTVLVITVPLALLFVAGGLLLARALRLRDRAREHAERLASINTAVLETSREGMSLIDPDGSSLFRNPAMDEFVQAVGMQPGGNVYEELARVAPATADPEAFATAAVALRSESDLELTDELTLTGSGRSFTRYARPVRDVNGGLIGRLFGVRETTAEKVADRMKGELVATVSHELRTPLTGILGFTELLQTRDLSDEKRSRYLAMIQRETRRVTALVNDFLDLQRIEAGGFALALEEVDLAALLREEMALYDRPGAEHRLELRVPDEPLTVNGEPDRLRQVIGNLLSNAIKYSPDGGIVEVSAETRDGFVHCAVSDQGLGIPESAQRRIFQKFFRADSSETRTISGTGLGLALSRELIDAHGGRMGFVSTEGEGSTFWFELPGTRVAARDGMTRVLVVEDEPELRTLIADLLTEAGYAIERVATGEAALAATATAPPAAVVLNIHLAGDIDGWQVLTELKGSAATAHVPVIVATGLESRRQAGVLGATDYLAKPFTAGELLGAIARALDGGAGDVLVVDDEESVRRLIGEMLSSEGYNLREAADGQAALAAIRAQLPDAVLLDLLMPKLDGFGVLEQLRQDPELRDLPVVVLTGKKLSRSERDLLTRRADSLLEKSAYSGDELRRLIEEAIGRRTQEQDPATL